LNNESCTRPTGKTRDQQQSQLQRRNTRYTTCKCLTQKTTHDSCGFKPKTQFGSGKKNVETLHFDTNGCLMFSNTCITTLKNDNIRCQQNQILIKNVIVLQQSECLPIYVKKQHSLFFFGARQMSTPYGRTIETSRSFLT
jgi:hypothetical protein